MTPTEMNAVLTFAALLDPRMKRTDPVDAADRAEAWASALHTDVTVDEARAAVEAHYRVSREPIMLADLVDLLGTPVESPWVDRTDEVLDQIMLRELTALDATPEQYRNDPKVRARVDAALDARAIEEAHRG